MPGRISSLDIIWSFIPVAALTSVFVSYPLFNGFASWIFRIFVEMVFSNEAIAISSVWDSFPS